MGAVQNPTGAAAHRLRIWLELIRGQCKVITHKVVASHHPARPLRVVDPLATPKRWVGVVNTAVMRGNNRGGHGVGVVFAGQIRPRHQLSKT